MVTALAVLGLVVDCTALDFHLTCRKIALEVGGIVHSIPEAELQIAEYSKRFRCITLVGQHQTVNFTVIAHRNKQFQLGGKTVFLAGDGGIPQTMAALVKI